MRPSIGPSSRLSVHPSIHSGGIQEFLGGGVLKRQVRRNFQTDKPKKTSGFKPPTPPPPIRHVIHPFIGVSQATNTSLLIDQSLVFT